MTMMRNTEPEDYEFHGAGGLEILEKRIQLMANVLGECVFITGKAKGHKRLRLTPSSHFVASSRRSILFACWPIGFCYKGRFYKRCEDN